MRCFLACELPAAVHREIAKWLKTLEGRVGGVRWVDPANVHLTVRFLGEVDEATLEQVKQASSAVAQRAESLELHAAGSGVFPNLRRPRVVWVGLEGAVESFERFYLQLEAALAGLDIHQESRPRQFRPHITLGRIRHPAKAKGIEKIILAGKNRHFGEVPIRVLTLFQSELTSSGPKYTKLAEFELGG